MNDIFKAYDFKNEQQWLKGRMNGIGGSDASAVVGMNPYKSNIDLFEEKIGRVIPKDISDKGLNCSLQKRDTIEMDALQAIPVIENYQLPIFLRDSIWKRNLERRSKP